MLISTHKSMQKTDIGKNVAVCYNSGNACYYSVQNIFPLLPLLQDTSDENV
jgi:hypothetical protein